MTPICKNTECFANLKGRCYALQEVDRKGKCHFFKLPSEVDKETLKILYPKEKKPIPVKTETMNDKQFYEWFPKEWNETTLSLLVNHGDEIARIKIALEA